MKHATSLRLKKALSVLSFLFWFTLPAWAAETKPVNVNTASMAELMSIKGIGEAKARAIIEHREKHGPFKTVDELKNVSGIGDKLLATLKPQLTVGEGGAHSSGPSQAPGAK